MRDFETRNKDLYQHLCEAKADYYREVDQGETSVSFDSWLFRRPTAEPEDKKLLEEDHDCKHCRFFLNLEELPLMNMASKCLLGFGQASADGSCEEWQPAKKEEEHSCFNCANGRPIDKITACVINEWETRDDGDCCEQWKEKK